jgi:hypothetical protein
MHGDQGVSFYGEEYDQFLSANRTPTFIYVIPSETLQPLLSSQST